MTTKISAALSRPPKYLGSSSKREWRRIVALIGQKHELSGLHREALTRYVVAWSLFEKASEGLSGASVGELEPLSQAIARAQRMLRTAAQDLGIKPPGVRPEKILEGVSVFDTSELGTL